MSNDVTNILKKICFALTLVLFWGCFIAQPMKSKNDAMKDITAGYITRKEIKNPYTTLFTTTDTRYCLYIEGTYEHDGKTETFEKYFVVSEDVYRDYQVGEYFDSQNY